MYVPENLDPVYVGSFKEKSQPFMDREKLAEIAQSGGRAVIPVSGDCMEAAGITDGGFAAVDFGRFPAPPRYRGKGSDRSSDICLCICYGNKAAMYKEYLGLWGSAHLVGTRYDLGRKKLRMNAGYLAEKIFGVVYASYDSGGHLLWERDPESFPKVLPQKPTITGGNAGNPIPVSEWKKRRNSCKEAMCEEHIN